jgi:hypothetical protein
MDWAFTFQAAMRNVFWGLIRTPPADSATPKGDRGARVKSNQLADRRAGTEAWPAKYVAGERFTMGDIPIGCRGAALDALPDRGGPTAQRRGLVRAAAASARLPPRTSTSRCREEDRAVTGAASGIGLACAESPGEGRLHAWFSPT